MDNADLCSNLRSLLRSSGKNGIPLKRLDEEFYTFTGHHIPLGTYKNLEELLKTMPEVCAMGKNDKGQALVTGNKQRGQQTATVIRGGSKGGVNFQRGKRPPSKNVPARTQHYHPMPRPGPTGGIMPRRLPQSSSEMMMTDPNDPYQGGDAHSSWGASGGGGPPAEMMSSQWNSGPPPHAPWSTSVDSGGGMDMYGGSSQRDEQISFNRRHPQHSHRHQGHHSNGHHRSSDPRMDLSSGSRGPHGSSGSNGVYFDPMRAGAPPPPLIPPTFMQRNRIVTGFDDVRFDSPGQHISRGGLRANTNNGHSNGYWSNGNTHNGHQQMQQGGGSGGAPMSPGHVQTGFIQKQRNIVWINPNVYNRNAQTRVYRDRPNAIPIVDPRSRNALPFRRGGSHSGGISGGPAGSGTSAREMLEEYCKGVGLPMPEFQVMEHKTNKKATAVSYLCTVEVDGNKYKSYPDYKSTEDEAKEVAATKAVSALNIATKETLNERVAERLASLPLAEVETASQIEEVANKLARLLDACPNGLFCSSVPQLFATKYKQKLNDDWQNKVKEHKLLDFVANDVMRCDVMYKKEGAGGGNSSELTSSPDGAPQVPPLILAAAEQFMFVTTLIVDVNNFYGRVEREEFHKLLADMDTFYASEGNKSAQKLESGERPVLGALYAVHDENWHRVQCVSEADGGDGGDAEFRYVDLGINEVIPADKLMHLSHDFYTVPFLAVQLRFEEFEDQRSVSDSKRPSVTAQMERLMQNKILWAVPAPGVDLKVRPLPVKVYDTGDDTPQDQSDQLDINTEIYKVIATPVIFPAPVVAKGYLSCVSHDGTIYLQIEDFGLSELRSFSVEPASDQHVESVQESKVYCAQFEKEWVRCVPTNVVSNTEIEVDFIDYGSKETIELKKIFPLKTGSHLEDLPAQAVRAHITDILPEECWSEEDVNKITDFCPEDQLLIIKISALPKCKDKDCDESIYHVDVFKRVQPTDELVSVNLKLAEILNTKQRRQVTSNGDSSSSLGDGLITENGKSSGESGSSPPLRALFSSPPEIGSDLDIHVLSAASPHKLVVQPFNSLGLLANLRAQMQLFYGKKENRIGVDEFEIVEGGFYACLQDGMWERGYVEKAQLSAQMVVCYFVDNGAYMPLQISAESVQPLDTQFTELECQAIQASLHNVAPKQGAQDFDPMDCIKFQKHIAGRDLEGKICTVEKDSRISVAPTFSLALDLFEDEVALVDTYVEMDLLTKVISPP